MGTVIEDFDRCYKAAQSKDSRFDGWFFTAVTSTGIYCRPSCPAKTPKSENVRFFPTSAGAQQAGFRACLRCRPDAAPGSPEWLGRADVAARAVKLILFGVVDTDGVSGLARRLGYSERQLHRVLMAEVGTGALALARAQRAQTARLLLETTDLPAAHVAFASGFASIRQFNDTVKEIFARTPSELRTAAQKRRPENNKSGTDSRQSISLRLAFRKPFCAEALMDFLSARAIPGVEAVVGNTYCRSLNLPNGPGTVELTPDDGYVMAVFTLSDLRDLTTAVARSRHLLNLDSDPVAIDAELSKDALLRPFVKRHPGLRVPGAADGFEIATRAVIGQQVSVSGARTVAARLAQAAGEAVEATQGVTHTFPSAEALADLAAKRPDVFAMPSGRRRALQSLAESVAVGKVTIDPGADPEELTRQLTELRGIGPWTASYVVMRALGNPDAFMPTDLGLRRAAAQLGMPDDERFLVTRAERWRPWRAYAMCHLWSIQASAGSDKHVSNAKAKGETAA
jgi:AraC family transcriptional regulator, regulatory protein of adaptative response / DNA-3-methyladenine glycosylase II